jgi:hypothetical protein
MTTPRRDEQPIVLHGPLTGDPERIVEHPRSLPEIAPDVVAHTDVVGPLIPTARVEVATPGSVATERPEAQPRTLPAPAVSVAPTERVFGLDVFRGVLLLAMNFTFTIPPWGPFPKWMYHTQVPPSPTREYVGVAGLTWQDFLFAMFVFTMAAAIPIAMGGRLARGKPYPDIVFQSIRRGALLLLFALLIGHVNPYWTQDYTKRGNILALAGLLVCFAVFVQPPATWKAWAVRGLRYAGWAGVAALLFVVPTLVYGQTFSTDRRDYIMAALAFATVAGTAVWLLTRKNVGLRLGIFGVIVAGRALATEFPAVGQIWYANPAPAVYQPWYLELLLVIIPGTIAGDLIWRWMQKPKVSTTVRSWSTRRLAALAAIGWSFIPILCIGLYERRYPMQTTVAVIAMCAAMLVVTRGAGTERDRVLARLFAWASLWLVAGMLAEPLEGGIKKDPQTLGFLLLMAGSAMAALGGLMILSDIFRSGRRALRPAALIGQNALFAYVIIMLGFEHVLWLTGIGGSFTSSWQAATVRSVVLTGLAGALVWYATRKKLIWKT